VLQGACAAGKRLPITLVVRYAIDIAKGLVELHKLGVICAGGCSAVLDVEAAAQAGKCEPASALAAAGMCAGTMTTAPPCLQTSSPTMS